MDESLNLRMRLGPVNGSKPVIFGLLGRPERHPLAAVSSLPKQGTQPRLPPACTTRAQATPSLVLSPGGGGNFSGKLQTPRGHPAAINRADEGWDRPGGSAGWPPAAARYSALAQSTAPHGGRPNAPRS